MLRITLAWQTVGISKSARLHFFYWQLYGGGCRAASTKVIHFDFIFWPLRLIRRRVDLGGFKMRIDHRRLRFHFFHFGQQRFRYLEYVRFLRIKLWWLDNFGFRWWRSLYPNLRRWRRRRKWNLR